VFGILGIIIIKPAKFFFWPIVLPIYRMFLKSKSHYKNLLRNKINYLPFIKKYLPGLTIVIIIFVVSANSIFAKTYDVDEYASKSLLPSLITRSDEGWSELIEETATITDASPIARNYVEEQGALQEIVIATPFAADVIDTDLPLDDPSLVLLSLDNAETEKETKQIIRSEIVTYTVQAGDVLGKIAEEFGISVNTLLWENKLTWRSTIRPGQKLNILPNSGINHEVKSGDTVLGIAKKYQTEAKKIIANNKLANASDIKIGDLLFIPDGIKPTQVTSSYKPKTVASVYSNDTVAPASNDIGTKLLWPVNSHRITQYYHWGHSGLDVGDKTGSPIYASEAGKVERSGWSRGYGYNVVINHGNGMKTLYAHASSLLVKTGESVSRGQTIALIGSTGWSTGPHIHFEVRINEVRKNPLNYIR
jgi:murein DD-endopeptidase MepM/ murein hydrolase activator NlpD